MRRRVAIELLHSPACKGAEEAERLVRDVIAEFLARFEHAGADGPALEFSRVLVLNVDDPNAHRIYGSPTVLVNGRDSQLAPGVDPEAAGLRPSLA